MMKKQIKLTRRMLTLTQIFICQKKTKEREKRTRLDFFPQIHIIEINFHFIITKKKEQEEEKKCPATSTHIDIHFRF